MDIYKCPKIHFPKKSSQIEFIDTTPVGKFSFIKIAFFLHYCSDFLVFPVLLLLLLLVFLDFRLFPPNKPNINGVATNAPTPSVKGTAYFRSTLLRVLFTSSIRFTSGPHLSKSKSNLKVVN